MAASSKWWSKILGLVGFKAECYWLKFQASTLYRSEDTAFGRPDSHETELLERKRRDRLFKNLFIY